MILQHYLPNALPDTIALSEILNQDGGKSITEDLLQNGFFLKAALGHSSGKNKSFDRTSEFTRILSSYEATPENYTNEMWILQRRMEFVKEFRVHSFDADVIPGLTVDLNSVLPSKELDQSEHFVADILLKLPHALISGSLIGWDVGITNDGQYIVIEANFTGFHPKHHVGFQTSGYFQDNKYGPIACVWFNLYIKRKYNVSISTVEPGLIKSYQFFRDFIFYNIIFNKEPFASLFLTKEIFTSACIMYLSEEDNDLLVRLLLYFARMSLFQKYLVVTTEKYISENASRFIDYKRITIYDEYTLLKNDEFDYMDLHSEDRKEICCKKLIHLIENEKYIII